MNRKLPTVMILAVLVLVGAMYWVDLSYYTSPTTGFVTVGSLWLRYAILLLPVIIGILGLRTVGARSIGTLRVKNPVVSVATLVAGLCGLAYGGWLVYGGVVPAVSVWSLVLGLLFVWYGVWMALSARQLLWQKSAAPTHSAIFGILAALPFCALTIYRVLVKPTGLYRIGPFVKNFSALFAMLWFGVLLRALYIALTRSRVRWMYLIGLYTFLLCTCLELVQTLHSAINGTLVLGDLLEGLTMGSFGLVAGLVSVSIAGQPDPERIKEKEPLFAGLNE